MEVVEAQAVGAVMKGEKMMVMMMVYPQQEEAVEAVAGEVDVHVAVDVEEIQMVTQALMATAIDPEMIHGNPQR